MRQVYNNSIAWRIKLYNSYFAQIFSIQKRYQRSWGSESSIPSGPFVAVSELTINILAF